MTVAPDSITAPPVPILQHDTEFSALLDMYRARAPLRVLEVGTFHGGTLWHWIHHAAAGARVVSVDSYTAGVDNRGLFTEWATGAGCDMRLIAGDSHAPATIAAAAAHAPFDWIFIDAGHYLHEVSADWANYMPMCQPGGIVALHDILPPTRAHPEIEVAFLWQQIRDAGYTTREIIADPSADWGGIGIVEI